jgi:hypothetical protein
VADYLSPPGHGVSDNRHALAEQTSIALHRAVAERLRADPAILERARARVRSWLADGSVGRPIAECWAEILAGSPEEVGDFLVDPGQRARDLRQSSPFAGALRPRERWAIFRQARAIRPGS